MFNFNSNKFFVSVLAAVLSTFVISADCFATGVLTKVDEDGKTYTVEQSGPFREMLVCGGVKAYLSVTEINEKKPDVMAVVLMANGSQTSPMRLMDEFSEYLDTHHTRADLEVGCLSGNGGIGMIFKSTDEAKENSFVQLDRYGRLYGKFDQTGYTLLPFESP